MTDLGDLGRSLFHMAALVRKRGRSICAWPFASGPHVAQARFGNVLVFLQLLSDTDVLLPPTISSIAKISKVAHHCYCCAQPLARPLQREGTRAHLLLPLLVSSIPED